MSTLPDKIENLGDAMLERFMSFCEGAWPWLWPNMWPVSTPAGRAVQVLCFIPVNVMSFLLCAALFVVGLAVMIAVTILSLPLVLFFYIREGPLPLLLIALFLSSCRELPPWDYRLGRRAFITREMEPTNIPHTPLPR